jgi:hypothetical protein
MIPKKNLWAHIRGWFPHDPIIRSQVLAPQKKPKGIWLPIENIVAIPIIVAGVAAIFLLSNSWIKYMLIGSALVLGFAILLSWSKTTIRRAVKFGLVGVMVFALCFSAFEGYLFWNSGYPPTYSQSIPDVTVTMTGLANLSVAEIVHNVEATPTFSLLELEHGSLAFDSMSVHPSGDMGGYIEVNFFSAADHTFFHFCSSKGHPYIMQQMTYSGQRLAEQSIGGPVETSFSRIDEVGLYTFYRQALQLAQNRTSTMPSVDSLYIAIAFAQSTNVYGGLTVQLICSHETPDPKGGVYGHSFLISEFSPDGTLMYMPWPAQANTA